MPTASSKPSRGPRSPSTADPHPLAQTILAHHADDRRKDGADRDRHGHFPVDRASGLTGAVPQPGKNLERKMMYLPLLNAVLLCDSAGKDLSLYRF